MNNGSVSKLKTILESNISRLSNKNNNDNEFKDIQDEITKMEALYNEMKSFIDQLKNSKAAIKSISELYSNLISLAKLISDLKDKKHKAYENELKLVKSSLDIIQKLELLNLAEKNDETSINAAAILRMAL